MSLNAANSRIYLTKNQARQGACVVDSYKVSDGTLQPVDVFPAGSNWVTNLYIEGLDMAEDTVSVAEFSQALLQNNAGLRSGDQLSFIRVTQLNNNTTGIPYVQVRAYELIINEQGPGLLKDFWPFELLGTESLQGTDALMVKNNNKQGGFAIIVSRTQGGRVLVSPSQITQVNMSAIINKYSSSAALAAAIDSYGKGDDVFLDSNSASTIIKQPTTMSLTGIQSTDGTEKAAVGGEIDINSNKFETGLTILFNQDIAGEVEQVKATYAGSVLVTDTEATAGENKVNSTKNFKPTTALSTTEPLVIEVTISGIVYSAEFTVTPGTIG